MNFRKNFDEETTAFPMAPMIDIVFLLLIFFMVASIWAQWETRVDITIPQAVTGEERRRPTEVIVNLDKEGRIFVNEMPMSASQLRDFLAHIAQAFPGQPVVVRGDRETDFQHVIRLLDVCRRAGVHDVSFATDNPEDEATPAQP